MSLRTSAIAVALACAAAGGQAATVLPPGATWEYTFTAPGPGWETGAGAGWLSGAAPFGNTGSAPFAAATNWPADGLDGDDLWVRAQVDFTGFDRSTAAWNLGVDNGFKLYINGTQIAADNAEGFTFRWEYSGAIGSGLLNPGMNWVAVALEDHGGATAFDMEILAREAPPVPEPASYALMLAGLAGLAVAARRRR